MKPVPDTTQAHVRGKRIALAVLVLAFGATLFATWRERELRRQAHIIQWHEGFGQLQPILASALGQRFETLRDQAKLTLRREGVSEASWNHFLDVAEWRQRFPGMAEIGYAEYEEGRCVVKFVDSQQSKLAHLAGTDLSTDTIIRNAIEKCADAGFSIGSRETTLGETTNGTRVIVGLMPLPRRDAIPGTPAENRSNLLGFVFYALDQQQYFRSIQPQLKMLALDVKLLAPGEASPPRTENQRPFSNTGSSGEWRFVATRKAASFAASAPQWFVLLGGTALSLLLYFLFATQNRLRYEAELAREHVLQRDAEILALNRGLEENILAATAELNEQLAKEKELNRLKDNFISMVTHEIRTPLALILGSSEILARYLDRLAPEKRADHLRTIDSAVQRMNALMEDVLLFSKAESGRVEFKPAPLDLREFCPRLADELAAATYRRCPIEFSVSNVTENVRADAGLLRHIFSNLIDNAVKYSPPGTPVKCSVSRDGGQALFLVEDRGMGIPEVDRPRLFTPFHRGRNVATIQGSGLGLAIVKHCVERHGGRIEVESLENRGTTVSVWLPMFSPDHTEFVRQLAVNGKS
jgi:signal transduction histidine kinase